VKALLGAPQELRVGAGLEAEGLGDLESWFQVFRVTQVGGPGGTLRSVPQCFTHATADSDLEAQTRRRQARAQCSLFPGTHMVTAPRSEVAALGELPAGNASHALDIQIVQYRAWKYRTSTVASTRVLVCEHMPLLQPSIDHACRCWQAFEVWRQHGEWVTAHNPQFGPGVKERLEMAAAITEEEVAACSRQRARWVAGGWLPGALGGCGLGTIRSHTSVARKG
jgi:hypothetical protein